MANESGKNERRISINYWDGINAVVDKSLAKPQELLHAENARSKIVGTIEKREGQMVLGVDANSGTFVARENYGLTFVTTGFEAVNGLYRLSGSTEGAKTLINIPLFRRSEISVGEDVSVFSTSGTRAPHALETLIVSESVTVTGLSATRTISVFDSLSLGEQRKVNDNGMNYFVDVLDSISYTEPPFFIYNDPGATYLDNTDYEDVNVYKLSEDEVWNGLTATDAKNIAGANFSSTVLDGKVFFVNGRDYNRYVDQDGVTVVTSKKGSALVGLGDLYNSPRSKLINAYKTRLYLANYDWYGTHYGNTVLQSSTPLGILALLQEDVASPSALATDNYPTSGLENYWSFNESSGNALDTVGGLDLSGTGTYSPGHIGNALNLGGSTSHLEMSNSGAGSIKTGPFSISTWIKLNEETSLAGETFYPIFTLSDSVNEATYGIAYSYTGGTPNLSATVTIGTSYFQKVFGVALGTSAWHHLVMVYNAGSVTLYLDNVAVGSTNTGVSTITSWNGIYFGSNPGSPTHFSPAMIDETGMWNVSLTASQVNYLYNNGAGLPVSGQWVFPVTDTTYFYADQYANQYEVWRLNQKIADVTISSMDDLNVYAPTTGVVWSPSLTTRTFLSQDQWLVKGSVSGPKVYRWPNSPAQSGQPVKQYSTFKLSGGDESDITVMQNIGNIMLIANKSSMASWNDSVLNSFDMGIGIPSERGYVKAYGGMYFIHYSGVYATSGSIPTIISSPIQPYIDGATKQGIDNAVGGRKGRNIFFCVGDVTLYNPDGSVRRVLRDTCLEYNLLQQNWYVHTNVKATEFESFLDTASADRLALTDSATKDVKVFLEGDSDTGDEIFFRADTQSLPIAANVEDLSNPQVIVIESERGSSMEVFVSIDDDDYYAIEGHAEKGITRLQVNDRDPSRGEPPIGHYISLSFRDGSKQRNKIGRTALTFVPAGVSNLP